MLEVVIDGVLDVEVRERPDSVPLSAVHYGARTAHKVVCVECRHQVNPKTVAWGPDGAVCAGCRNDS